jgi:6-phosphogluconolactonase
MLEAQREHESLSNASRRMFLKGAASIAVAGPAFARSRQNGGQTAKGRLLAYVGCDSSPKSPDTPGKGKGIYLFRVDTASGALSEQEVFPNDANPAWIDFDPSRTHLYSANEITNFQGSASGSVSAYAIDRSSGRLTLLNTVSSEGAGPAHLSVHPSGRYLLVANYAGGTAAVIALRPNGELGPATDVKHDKGPVGPTHAASAPPGSFAISGHDAPHVHMIQSDPSGRYVLSSDLGMDKIMIWKFDLEKGKLVRNNPASVSLPPGDGPRHFDFHPNGRWMYSLQEEGSTVTVFDYDSANGSLIAKQTISSLPPGFVGTNFPSEIKVSSDGKFVYAANRLHDSIAFFSVASDGKLTFAGEEWTRGDYPRSFGIDPSGTLLYSCNQYGDSLATYRINRQTGALDFTGQYTAVGTPGCIIFLNL